MSTLQYDHVIVGTGQALSILLGRLIPTRKRIAVIEKDRVGGSCVNFGCTPTKALVASAKVLHQTRRSEFYGFETGPIKLNFEKVYKRMNEVRNPISNFIKDWME